MIDVSLFSINPSSLKKHKEASHKESKRILYAVAHKDDNGIWQAYVNTRGLEGYNKEIVIPFTDKSLSLKDRLDVFYHEKDNTKHWRRVIRSAFDAEFNPGSQELYCSLCEDSCFSGYIVKDQNGLKFDMLSYKGSKGMCNNLLTKDYSKEKDEEINECD